MKAFQFNGEEYTDLNELGLAYAGHFDLALQSIQEKSFLKFVKSFKEFKMKIKQILFQTRYLQNALSIIIYTITEDHLLIVGHRFYSTIKECILDLKKNPALQFFAEDHGFSNTFLQTLQDEKMKADIITFENNSRDEFALDYISNYYSYDALDSLDSYLKNLNLADLFKSYFNLFNNADVLKILAQKTSLQEVLELKASPCPIFKGFILAQIDQEQVLEILDKAFYLSILHDIKQYKFKGDSAKKVYKQLKLLKKQYKKYNKISFLEKMKWHERMYFCYLRSVDSFKSDHLACKEECYNFSIPYCDTYINLKSLEEGNRTPDLEKEYKPLNYVEYNMKSFMLSFRNHFYFSFWGIIFILLFGVYYALSFFGAPLEPATHSNLTHPANLLFLIGASISIILFITILIIRTLAKGKYKSLCKLAYYRKHKDILTEKQQIEFEKIEVLEGSYAKKIDRFYRFYGGIAMGGFSMVTTTLFAGIIQNYFSQNFEIFKSFESIMDTKIYFLVIPAIVCFLLGLARHKKTSWSILFTLFFSIGLTLGIGLI